MQINLFEAALGGIGLFLLGVRLLSEGIASVSTIRIRGFFSRLTANRAYSLVLGILFTCAVNSGTAAVIFTMALLSGGVLTPFQSLCVLSGVLVGSALLLYLHIVPYSLVAGPLILFGVLLKFFARRRTSSGSGDLLLGVGLLYVGLMLLEGGYRATGAHPLYDLAGGVLYANRLVAFVFGTVVSTLVQSGGTATRIAAALAESRHVSPGVLVAMVSGSVLGMSLMGLLAAAVGKSAARRVAWTFFGVHGTVTLVLLLVGLLLQDVRPVTDASLLFAVPCLTSALALVFLAGPLSRTVLSSQNGGTTDAWGQQPCAGYLDRRILDTPPIALEQARKEAVRMFGVAGFMYADVRLLLGGEFDARRAAAIRQHEQVLDTLNHEITSYLTELLQKNVPVALSVEAQLLLQLVSSVEHIGDVTEKLLDGCLQQHESRAILTDAALADLEQLGGSVGEIMQAVSERFSGQRNGMDQEQAVRKQELRARFEAVKQAHFERICAGTCPADTALLYSEQVMRLQRIAELCWFIGEAIRGT